MADARPSWLRRLLDGEFWKQVLIQTLATVFAGLILAGLAIVLGYIQKPPVLAAVTAIAVGAAILGVDLLVISLVSPILSKRIYPKYNTDPLWVVNLAVLAFLIVEAVFTFAGGLIAMNVGFRVYEALGGPHVALRQ